MTFEWDPAKDAANLQKHGLSFSDAVDIFDGPVLTLADTRQDYGEDRFLSVGELAGVVVIVVVHTPRNGRTRLISARRANERERRLYHEHIT